MTPDWEAKPTDVPYANFGNPQSLNLYSYVQNNPTTVGDPDGHELVYVDSQAQKQFERISKESTIVRDELKAAKVDPSMDVKIQQVGVQQLPNHAPADTTAYRDANGVLHVTINTNPSDDRNAEHELGHEEHGRTNTEEFLRQGKEETDDRKNGNLKDHDSYKVEQRANQFRDRVEQQRKEYRQQQKELKREEKKQLKKQKKTKVS